MKTLSQDLFKQATDALYTELCAIGQEIEDQYLEAIDEKAGKAKLPISCKIILVPLGQGKVGGDVKVTVNRGKIETTSTIGSAQQALPME